MILVAFAFLAGLVTILSPCILPILPIVLSGSLQSGKSRPLGVITGFIASFTFFAVFSFSLANAFGFSTEILRNFAVVLLILFGLATFTPKLQLFLENITSRFSSLGQGKKRTGFSGGFILGITLGLIWTPCVGPILASVLTLAATSTITFQLILITFSYSLGTAIPLFFIAYGGKRALTTLPFFKKNAEKIQKTFGVLIILTAFLIFFNLDRKFQTYILDVFPMYGEGLTAFENNEKVESELNKLKNNDGGFMDGVLSQKTPAPNRDFIGATRWLQSEPLTLDALKGKVVLVDFWTYTCINCIRTFPHLTGWYEKYKDDGLVIIGVHTPEFEFEKNQKNVLNALEEYGITYPVVQDNDYKIWNSYSNRYWPAHYLIDKDGNIRYTHFGEGEYEKTEKVIQELLRESGKDVDTDILDLENYAPTMRNTPETYLGYGRMERFASPEKILSDINAKYSVPSLIESDFFAYGGVWNITDEYSESSKNAVIDLSFKAKEVFLVMRPKDLKKPGEAIILIDGKPILASEAGVDVNNGIVNIDQDRLYKLVKFGEQKPSRVTIQFNDAEIQVFAFTFG